MPHFLVSSPAPLPLPPSQSPVNQTYGSPGCSSILSMVCGVKVANHGLGGAGVSWWPTGRWKEARRPPWEPGAQQKPCLFRKAVSIWRRGTKGPGDCSLDMPQLPLALPGPLGKCSHIARGVPDLKGESWRPKDMGNLMGEKSRLPWQPSPGAIWSLVRVSGMQ